MRPADPPTRVLLLHGTNDTSATLAPLARGLARAGLEPLPVDYGRDRSSLRGRLGRRGGLADLAASTQEVLDHLDALLADDPSPVQVVGHSQGGLHALALARARPHAVARVVLLGTPLGGVLPLGRASTLLHRGVVARLVDRLLGPAARAQVRGDARMATAAVAPPGVQTLLVVSDDDRTVRARDVQAGGSVRVLRAQDLPGAGRVSHVGLATDPVVVAHVVRLLLAP